MPNHYRSVVGPVRVHNGIEIDILVLRDLLLETHDNGFFSDEAPHLHSTNP
jgi:hypothetical protein